MKKYISYLHQLPLFTGIEESDIENLLTWLRAVKKAFGKGQQVYAIGDRVTSLGIIVSGSVQAVNDDAFGNRNIIGEMGNGEMFGEAFACADKSPLPLSIEAQTESEIIFLNYKQIITSCASSCIFHNRLIENMVSILAYKNIILTKKIRHLSKRTTRDKLLSYLVEEAQKAGSRAFNIPFSRQELADYLCVERSAMSTELSKLRKEGIIETNRSKFFLLMDHHLD